MGRHWLSVNSPGRGGGRHAEEEEEEEQEEEEEEKKNAAELPLPAPAPEQDFIVMGKNVKGDPVTYMLCANGAEEQQDWVRTILQAQRFMLGECSGSESDDGAQLTRSMACVL
jgi:hypothetical protein